jgi:drug/metabolite transporter (DMT)-like permease
MTMSASATPGPQSKPDVSAAHAWAIALLCLLGAGALLGLSTNLAKVAHGLGLPPLSFLAWSVAGAAAFLIANGAVRGHLARLRPKTLRYFSIAALVSVAAPNLLFYAAVPHVGAGFVAVAIALPPLLTYAGALLLGLERFAWKRAAGVLLALVGALWLAVQKLQSADVSGLWVAAALFGPVLLAAGNLYRTLDWPRGEAPDALAPGMLAGAAVQLFALGLVAGEPLAVPTATAGPILLILAQAITFGGLYLLFFVVQKRGGPVFLSLLGSVAAVVGVPIAVLGLGETPPPGLAIGAFLIAAGVALVVRGAPRPAARPKS